MTVTVLTSENEFAGNGSATEFTTTFAVQAVTHLELYTIVDATGVATPLVLNTDFTVDTTTLNTENGCVITYPAAGDPLASGQTLLVRRVVPIKQLLDIQNQAGFNPSSLEDQLDLIVMIIQQLSDLVDKSFRFFNTEPPAIVNLSVGALCWDGTKVVNCSEVTEACPVVRTVSGTTDTPVAGDGGKLLYFTSDSAVTVTMQNDADAAWPASTMISFLQGGDGQVTLSFDGDITVVKAATATAATGFEGAIINAIKLGDDLWAVSGATA